MITKERLNSIKENVYMRSEIAKFSGLGIDTSLREELELIEEIDRLNNIINECSDDILKELEENNHLSYGVALSIRNKLLDYKILKEQK